MKKGFSVYFHNDVIIYKSIHYTEKFHDAPCIGGAPPIPPPEYAPDPDY